MASTALSEPLPPGVTIPPTQDELPCDDGVPMETERHRLQMELLIHTLNPWLGAARSRLCGRQYVCLFQHGAGA